MVIGDDEELPNNQLNLPASNSIGQYLFDVHVEMHDLKASTQLLPHDGDMIHGCCDMTAVDQNKTEMRRSIL